MILEATASQEQNQFISLTNLKEIAVDVDPLPILALMSILSVPERISKFYGI